MPESDSLERKLILMRLTFAAESLKYIVKANFNPNQPRIPADNPGGGRWTDGLAQPASYKPEDFIDLRREEGKRGAHTILHHVGKTDSELVARMGPPLRWWQAFGVVMYRNGTFFSIEDANTYVNDTLRQNAGIVAAVADGRLERAFLKMRVGRKIGREAFRFDEYSELQGITPARSTISSLS
ncbi:MAG: hypothetical protein QHC90_30265 [Shinella sp.]|nr:hypothetical protein [Shinella sp.]